MSLDSDHRAMRSALSDLGKWACILALLAVAGCGPVKEAVSWFTGEDKPAVVGEDQDGDGVPDASPAARVIEAVKDLPIPYSETGAAILAWIVARRVERARAKKKGAVA